MRTIRALCVLGMGLTVSGCCEDGRMLSDYADLAAEYEGEEAAMLELAGLIYPKLDCDDDGLTNEEEDALGSSMYRADTDGDGFSDFEETEAGTDPLNASSFPEDDLILPSDINKPITCDSVTEVGELHHFAGDAFSDDEKKYYRTYDTFLGGPECVCTVDREGISKVTGISVFMPTKPLEPTDWSNQPVPRGVWVETPWGTAMDAH
ncbi:MAG: thrombospondin type 3 repeat-containing protein, partial [Myxococcota bacterium]